MVVVAPNTVKVATGASAETAIEVLFEASPVVSTPFASASWNAVSVYVPATSGVNVTAVPDEDAPAATAVAAVADAVAVDV